MKNRIFKLAVLILSIAIVIASLWYTNLVAEKVADQEKERITIWAEAIKELGIKSLENPSEDVSFIFGIIERNNEIPAIIVDENGVIIATTDGVNTEVDAQESIERLKKKNDPIRIETPLFSQKVYYDNSFLLKTIRLFPIIQFSLIGVLFFFAYLLFDSIRKTQQDKVWVGMAKETAHQLGTPLSSIIGWIESLKLVDDEESKREIVNELSIDMQRLQLIADRFSKIGSPPEMVRLEINQVVDDYYHYLRARAPLKVTFVFEPAKEELFIHGNELLLSWVVENLMKNALDAMEGEGTLVVTTGYEGDEVTIEVKDTGKGIARGEVSKVFEPGFTTKKRGWGLGLSLAKRIIEDYHHGKIFVKSTEVNVGTTFKVVLAKVKD